MKRLLMLCAAMMAVALRAHTVSLGQVICNSGTTVTVPVMLDTAVGLASIVLTVSYDPLVLVSKGVRPGPAAAHFDLSFSSLAEERQVTVVCAAVRDIQTSKPGALALLDFEVRAGSEGLYSDLALTEVVLNERTMTLDLRDQTVPKGGLLRPFVAGGTCTARMGKEALMVAPGTTLKTLALTSGDALLVAKDQPVVITDALTVEASTAKARTAEAPTIRLEPLEGQWTPGRYEVLKCPSSATIALAEPNCCTLTSRTEGNQTIYALEASDGTPLGTANGETIYTVNSIAADASVELTADSVLLTERNTVATTAKGKSTGNDARQVAELLGGHFTASKTEDNTTCLTYAYDLGIHGLEVRRNEKNDNLTLYALVALRDSAGAATRTLTGKEVIVTVTLGSDIKEYPIENPTFTYDAKRGVHLCTVSIPWEDFQLGTSRLTVRVQDAE